LEKAKSKMYGTLIGGCAVAAKLVEILNSPSDLKGSKNKILI